MSKVAIEGNASGTGTLTIAAPNTSTNRTLTIPDEAGTITTSNSPYSTFRNRIINGDMRIDQRNAGASITPTDAQYVVDRFNIRLTQASKLTAQQNQGSVTPPAGFTNYLGVTSSSAYSVISSDNFNIVQIIEGTNVADLGWGTANAKTVTLSFRVRSSLTGTFGGAITNSALDRSYPFSYTISVADTFEYKTVEIEGDTSGTWLTTNGQGIRVWFGLGVGTDLSGTADAWAATQYASATGAVSVVGTSGATFFITGVQLEVGSVATPFERRPFGTELSLCQRYFQCWGGTTAFERIAAGYAISSTETEVFVPRFNVVMRATPTLSFTAAGDFRTSEASGSFALTAIALSQPAANSTGIQCTVASGLTTNRPMSMDTNNSTSARLNLSSEL